MHKNTKTNFIKKETKRTERGWPHHLLGFALLINIIILWKVEPLVVGILIIIALLGMLSGYKLAFDRIKKRHG